MSYVYFILDETSNAIKIGKANDIDERISGLQTGNPNELILLHYIKCESVENAFNLEKYCHDKFEQRVLCKNNNEGVCQHQKLFLYQIKCC